MSGIVGIVNLDGKPIDRSLLRRMTDFMTFRGPDAQSIWASGNVGFGHTLLKTTDTADREEQPFTLDRVNWIVADARVDAQTDLITQLEARGQHIHRDATDVELLWRAYEAWGEDCVDHLLGDFAFAIWDGHKQRLFCARDQFGIKPFFYASIGRTLVFSNTLDCIRQHPYISDKLNDLAIADFLLFEVNQDPTTTSFADISRIPPAHRATWSEDHAQINRYWTLPVDEPVFFKRPDDYTGRFRELLEQSVTDRLRTNKVSVLLSGGLDSPTLAATAQKILRSRGADGEVHAFTTIIDEVDGGERHYSQLVAKHLGIPIHLRDRSTRMIDRDWQLVPLHTSEPVPNPENLRGDREQYQSIAACSRVLFYGEGPDNALNYEWKPYLRYLLGTGQVVRLAADVSRHIFYHKRIPLLPTIPRIIKERTERDSWSPRYPDWLNDTFESGLELRSRWEKHYPVPRLGSHPLRPAAYGSFHIPLWEALFRRFDAAETLATFEVRHPYLDLRLLRYMLSVPAIPWCRAKYLERRAMRDILPSAILRRRKTPLSQDPGWIAAQRWGVARLKAVEPLQSYLVPRRLPDQVGTDPVLYRRNCRPVALNYWFRSLQKSWNSEQEKQINDFITAGT